MKHAGTALLLPWRNLNAYPLHRWLCLVHWQGSRYRPCRLPVSLERTSGPLYVPPRAQHWHVDGSLRSTSIMSFSCIIPVLCVLVPVSYYGHGSEANKCQFH